MAVTLETFFTDAGAFAVTTASPVQRAACRIVDGRPLGELAQDDAVIRMVGGVEALEQLPAGLPTEFYLIAAIRCGKSKLSGAIALHRALTANLAMMKPTELARVSIVSVDRDKAKAVYGFILEALTHDESLLKRYLISASKERILVRRDDGRMVEIVVAAGSVGGRSLVSRWTIVAIFDEAARMLGKADGAVNFEGLRDAVIARLRLIGGQLIVVSSPWAARGPIFDIVQKHHGKPTSDKVVLRSPGPDMNPVLWTPEACERERLDPEGAYETDVLGLFVDPQAGFITSAQLTAATREAPVVLPPEPFITYTAAMDPATSGNAWTLVVVGRWPSTSGDESDDKYRVVLAHQWQGSRHEPLKARAVFGEMAPMLKPYRVTEVHSDRWAGTLIAEHGDYAGLRVNVSRDSNIESAQHFADFRTRVLDGRLELPPVPAMRADLLMVRKKLQAGGSIRYDPGPVTRDGRHADFAPAVVLAMARATNEPTWVDAMQALRLRGGQI